jgi:phosphoribosyl 1,2-cyclic phosphodiesterase
MRLDLYGGFGEKGRTCLGIESGGYRLLLDAGVKTSVRGKDDYYPKISGAALRAIDAIVITHGHEDHVAALGWLIAGGFDGRIFMTPETQAEAGASVASYALPEHLALMRNASIERLPVGVDAVDLGPLRISTGRSGHVAGGVWCRIDDGRVSIDYCGDVAPASPVFAMDRVPRCHAIVIDASYGDDDVIAQARAAEVVEWIDARADGCVLPTPLFGRSAELLAIVPGPIALAPGMRDALSTQIEGSRWLVDGIAPRLKERLDAAIDWREVDALPRSALLCHDAMGISGPSRAILADAVGHDWPTLFTGHLPAGSPGERMVAQGHAAWIRLPTHPTLTENLAIAAASDASMVLGHSCDRALLARLTHHLPRLRADVATGDCVEL